MTVISKVQESLHEMRVSILMEANDGLDSVNKINFAQMKEEDLVLFNKIENNLRSILNTMSR